MYAVVGCSDCSALWVVEGRPETTQCPRCGKRHPFQRRKKFAKTDDPDEAKQARAALLAERQDQSEAFADLDDFATMDRDVEDSGIDDETYLEESGLDPDTVAEAGDRAGSGAGGSASQTDIVETALRTLDSPTESEVLAYASEHGVDRETARKLLDKLRRAGEVTEREGHLRLL